MRTMGLDVGTKTVGIAISDELGITAQPYETLARVSPKRDFLSLKELATEHQVERFVVGLPLNMDGTEGARAKASRQFAQSLAEFTGLPVELWDERLTTVAANRTLLEADLSRKRRKEVVDTVAATLILQGWLDAHAAMSAWEDEETTR